MPTSIYSYLCKSISILLLSIIMNSASLLAHEREGTHPELSEVPTVWPDVADLNWSDLRELVLSSEEISQLEKSKRILVSLTGRNLQYYIREATSNIESYTVSSDQKFTNILKIIQSKGYSSFEKPLVTINHYSKHAANRYILRKLDLKKELKEIQPGDIVVFHFRKPWP